jgi:hypothetical protein
VRQKEDYDPSGPVKWSREKGFWRTVNTGREPMAISLGRMNFRPPLTDNPLPLTLAAA